MNWNGIAQEDWCAKIWLRKHRREFFVLGGVRLYDQVSSQHLFNKENDSWFCSLHFKSPLCKKSLKRRSGRAEGHSVRPQTKTYVWSFKKTTNPNVSPIGKRFGFECFGAGKRTWFSMRHRKSRRTMRLLLCISVRSDLTVPRTVIQHRPFKSFLLYHPKTERHRVKNTMPFVLAEE